MKTVYPAIFTTTKNCVLVEVPDLGILTEGASVADAIDMARDAIGSKCISMQDAAEPIPEPSALTAINPAAGTFADAGESILSMVDINLSEYRRRADNRMIRRNVTIPAWMDAAAEKAKINVSKCLQDALSAELQK